MTDHLTKQFKQEIIVKSLENLSSAFIFIQWMISFYKRLWKNHVLLG